MAGFAAFQLVHNGLADELSKAGLADKLANPRDRGNRQSDDDWPYIQWWAPHPSMTTRYRKVYQIVSPIRDIAY
jgi:hypothetical protein